MSLRVGGVGAFLFLSVVSVGCTVRMEVPTDGGADGRTTLDARLDARGGCTADRDCADPIACSIDRCVSGACTHTACVDCCPDDLACDTTLGCTTPPEPCTLDGECSDGVRCTLDACGSDGFCEHVSETGLCDDGEVCLAGVGCIPTPPLDCDDEEDCRRGSLCAADWLCEPEFGCTFVAPLGCDDDDECTVDGCDDTMGGCTHTPIDVDGDGHAPESCTSGDDCDDTNEDVSPDEDEVCNEIDDDCDDQIDEGCCEPGPCTTTCGTAGTVACNPDGTPTACMPPVEACNGIDDDCDGTNDEGCCTAGPCTTTCGTTGVRGCNPDGTPGECNAPAETCNDVDDDCDGTIDDGFACRVGASSTCTTGCGSTGTRACLAGCTLDAVCVPPTEICNGVDDDCDGIADDGFGCRLGSSDTCTTSCSSTGTHACVAGCNYEASCTPPTETCNGMDDDCDGTVDDGFTCTLGTSLPCPTTCGSTGTRSCIPGCTYDTVCAPPAEICNGVDDNCNGAVDEGFTCAAGSTRDCTLLSFYDGDALCRADCSGYDTSTCTNCGNGAIEAPEICDGTALGGATCMSRGFFTGTLRCGAGCTYDTSSCSNCGNNVVNAPESCDGTALAGATCMSRGYATGTLRCTAGCAYDETMCTYCGNGTIQPGESCDGANLNGETCASRGFASGTLACNPGCTTFNTTGCTLCGNGVVNSGEDCDGSNLAGATCMSRGYSAGTLSCSATCRYVTSACTGPLDYSGTYTVTPAPSYSCLGGIVSYNGATMTFADGGTTMTVTVPGMNCVMSGTSPRMNGGVLDVSCFIPGGCPENYRLMGTFSDNRHWTGTFTSTMGPGSCFGCTTRTFPGLSGVRP